MAQHLRAFQNGQAPLLYWEPHGPVLGILSSDSGNATSRMSDRVHQGLQHRAESLRPCINPSLLGRESPELLGGRLGPVHHEFRVEGRDWLAYAHQECR